jgi:Ca-activated chloride channel homolog
MQGKIGVRIMRNHARSVATASLIATTVITAPAGQSNTASQDQPVFRSSSDLVRVFVTVTDSNGRLVTSLGQDNFEVKDKGKVQPIEVFDNRPTPIRLMLMLDVSGSMSGNIRLVREAVDNLIAHLGPSDLARVGSFGISLEKEIDVGTAFSREPSTLLAAVPMSGGGFTPLYGAFNAALRILDTRSEERRVLLMVSDGKDGGGRGPRITEKEIADHARQSDVMIYAIGLRSRLSNRFAQPGSLTSSTLEDDLPSPVLARLAAETGGGYVELRQGQDLKQEFARIADELHSQYLVGFAPPVRDGKVHDIEVRVKQRGMKARARRDYVAPAR